MLVALRCQHAITVGTDAFPAQLIEAGDAPHIGADTKVLLQQLRRGFHLAQNSAGAQQLHLRGLLAALAFVQQIHAATNTFLGAFRHGAVHVVLVHQRQVVEDVLVVFIHALQAILQDHRHFVRVGGIVADAVRHRAGENMAVTVLVLQTFTIECGAPGGAAQQETACLAVTGGPPEIPGALEAEHGVVDKERNQGEIVDAVAGGRGDPGSHGAGFVDAFLEDLSFLVLAVVHHLAGIFRLVLLALGRVDTQLSEHAFHTEGSCFVGYDRHHPLAQGLVLDQSVEHAHERHGGGNFPVASAFQKVGEEIQARHFQGLAGFTPAHRHVAAQFLPLLTHVAQFRRILFRFVVGNRFQFFVGERHVEAIAEFLQALQIHLLHLVRLVDRFPGTGGVTLHGFRQNDGGLTGVVHRFVIGGIHLERIVAATVETIDVLIAHVLDHFLQLRIGAEEVLAGIGTAVLFVGLIFTVHALLHAAAQQPLVVFFQQRIPQPPPDHLDHVPPGAPEQAFQFLDDLAVAAHRTIQALQVTVDHEHQIIQLFPAGHGQRAQGFGLVHLAVAEKGPDLAVMVGNQLAILQVLHHIGLVDGLHRPQPHGHGGELPEIRHQPGVRIGR